MSGVSSMMTSTPVASSNARMLRPSRPMMRPFISSFGSATADTVDLGRRVGGDALDGEGDDLLRLALGVAPRALANLAEHVGGVGLRLFLEPADQLALRVLRPTCRPSARAGGAPRPSSFSSSSSRVCTSFSRRPKSLARRPTSRSRCSTASALAFERALALSARAAPPLRRCSGAARSSCSAASRSLISSSLPEIDRALAQRLRLALGFVDRCASRSPRRTPWRRVCRSSSARCPTSTPDRRPKKKNAGRAMTSAPSTAKSAIWFISDLCSTARSAGEGKPPLDPRSAVAGPRSRTRRRRARHGAS